MARIVLDLTEQGFDLTKLDLLTPLKYEGSKSYSSYLIRPGLLTLDPGLAILDYIFRIFALN